MDNSFKVHVIYENDVSDDVSVYEWADSCAIFFISMSIYPPYHCARRFANGGLMDRGMSGYLEWVGFDLTREMYGDLFEFFKMKNEKLVSCGDDQGLEVESDIDLHAWRYNIAFGVPYREHRLLLDECSRLEKDFRETLALGENKRAYSIYADLWQAQDRLDYFVSNYRDLKK